MGSPSRECGCRAAFHVGAVEWLTSHDLMPDVVAGASSGALIAGAIAIGRTSDLRSVWTELFGSRVMRCATTAARTLAVPHVGDRRRRRAPVFRRAADQRHVPADLRRRHPARTPRLLAAGVDRARSDSAGGRDPGVVFPARTVLAHGYRSVGGRRSTAHGCAACRSTPPRRSARDV